MGSLNTVFNPRNFNICEIFKESLKNWAAGMSSKFDEFHVSNPFKPVICLLASVGSVADLAENLGEKFSTCWHNAENLARNSAARRELSELGRTLLARRGQVETLAKILPARREIGKLGEKFHLYALPERNT